MQIRQEKVYYKLMTLINHLKAIFYVFSSIVPEILKTGQRPVIFSRWSGIGDIIGTMPSVKELAKKHPRSPIIYNCYQEFTILPKLAGISCKTTSFPQIGLIGNWYSFILSGYYQFTADDDNPEIPPKNNFIKEFAKKYKVNVEEEHPKLFLSQEIVKKVKKKIENLGPKSNKLIIIHPGPTVPIREWPLAKWELLVHELVNNKACTIVQIGTDMHFLLKNKNEIKIPGAISFVNKLSLEEAAALISLADLYIGVDSGMLHLAASLNVNRISLWGATSPEFRFSKSSNQINIASNIDCLGCHHRFPRIHFVSGCPYGVRCMQEIEVKEVLQSCIKKLEL